MLSASQRHSERLQVGGVKLVRNERVAMAVRMGLNTVYRVFLFVLMYNWLSFVLSCFPYTRVWGETLHTFLINLLAGMGVAILHAVPGLVTAGVIFLLAKWVSNLLHGFFERVHTGQIQLTWLDADVVAPTRRIAKTLVWLFALAMAYPYLPGSDTEAFKGLSVLAGLMISLGASNLVGQAASGLILTYGRVYRKGEYVRIAGSEGTVTEVGMFATRIRTGLGEELTIANSKIMGAHHHQLLARGQRRWICPRHQSHDWLRHTLASGRSLADGSSQTDRRRRCGPQTAGVSDGLVRLVP
jgi:small-conductance mechanosensitive channel